MRLVIIAAVADVVATTYELDLGAGAEVEASVPVDQIPLTASSSRANPRKVQVQLHYGSFLALSYSARWRA